MDGYFLYHCISFKSADRLCNNKVDFIRKCVRYYLLAARGARHLCRKFLNQYAEGLKQASAKLKDRERNLKKYCNENNLKYKVDRTATPGYNKSVSSKTNSAYKQFVYDKYSSYIGSSVNDTYKIVSK